MSDGARRRRAGGPARVARRLLDGLYALCGALAGACLVGLAALMLAVSLGRQVGWNVRGGDDLTAWALVASAFLGLAHTFKSGELVRMGLLVERLEGRARRRAELAALAVASLLLGAFAWYAARMVRDSWRFGEAAQGALPWPIWIPQAGMAVGVAVLFVAFLDELVRVARGLEPAYRRAPPATPDEAIARGGV